MSCPLRSKVFSVTLAIATVALVLAACGGGEEATATPQPTVAPTATPRPAATATAAPAQPTAQPTATRAPAQPTATPRPLPTPTTPPVTAGYAPPDFPQAKRGGQLRRRINIDPPSWDALRERTQYTQDVVQTTYDQLVQVNPYNESQVVPQLAESWTASSDGLTWTFKLRQGVRFHNGNPLTAQDIKYTFEAMILNPPRGVITPFKSEVSVLDTVATPDDFTVVMKLKEPDAAFLSGLGFGRMSIHDREFVEANGRDRMLRWPPMGTGPFLSREGGYVAGVSAEVFRNDSYYVRGRPFIDGQKFFVIVDDLTAVATFRTGQLNFGMPLNKGDADEAQRRLGDRVTIQTAATLTWWSVEINAQAKPFNDVRVREAIAWAVDKRGVIEAAVLGLGVLGGYLAPGTGWGLTDEELTREIAGYSSDTKGNIARAKKLLADAGYPNGFEANYFTRNLQTYIDHTTLVQAMLTEIGVRGKIEVVESGKYFADKEKPTAWSWAVAGHRTNGSDPNTAYRDFHLPGGPRNTSFLDDARMVELYRAQNLEQDPAKRRLLVKELERHSLKLYVNPVAYYSIAKYAWYSNVKNHQYHVTYQGNLQMRDVWME